MQENFIQKFFDKISYIKLSGIKRFLFIDVYSSFISITLIHSKEKIYNITRNTELKDYEIEFSLTQQINNISEIYHVIQNQKKQHDLEKVSTIININEFRVKQVTISNDNDDIELWFIENIGKYLPEGQSIENFNYNYKFIKEENDEFHYLITIVRKELISNIISACKKSEIRLLQIFALPINIHFLPKLVNELSLYINLTEDRLFFSYSDNENNFTNGEIYDKFIAPSDQTMNENLLKNALVGIKDSIFADKKNVDVENLCVVLHSLIDERNINGIIKDVFHTSLVNHKEKSQYQLTNTINSINTLNYSFEKKDGLLGEDFDGESEKIDKEIFNRVVLFLGGISIVLLLLTYSIEGVVENIKNNKEDTIVEAEAKVKLVESLEEENKTLLANLNSLKKIKEGGVKYNKIFSKLTKTLTSKTFLTGLNLSTAKKMNFILEGIVLDQADLSINIKNLEENKNFSNVSLLRTNVAKTADLDILNNFYKREVFLFKISIDYENSAK